MCSGLAATFCDGARVRLGKRRQRAAVGQVAEKKSRDHESVGDVVAMPVDEPARGVDVFFHAPITDRKGHLARRSAILT